MLLRYAYIEHNFAPCWRHLAHMSMIWYLGCFKDKNLLQNVISDEDEARYTGPNAPQILKCNTLKLMDFTMDPAIHEFICDLLNALIVKYNWKQDDGKSANMYNRLIKVIFCCGAVKRTSPELQCQVPGKWLQHQMNSCLLSVQHMDCASSRYHTWGSFLPHDLPPSQTR